MERWKVRAGEMDDAQASRILVVDDLPQNRDLVEGHLAVLGACVATASNGADALRKVTEETPDLILLDVMMPGLDGYEVCRRLKAEAATASIPVLVLTSLSAPEEMVRAIEAGADDFLGKPFSGLELWIRVRSLLCIKKLHEQVATYRRWASVGERAGSIAQEMRNPLAITSSAAQILLKKGADPRLRQECAEKIHAATTRAAALVEQFLRFLLPSGGVMEPRGVSRVLPVASEGAEGLEPVPLRA